MSYKFLESLLKPFGGRQNREGQREEEELEAIAAKEERVFRYETLVVATKGFSSNNKLGEGGFGPVYKGRLKDGREVAVKRLGRGSRQGVREFTNEAMLLSKVQHKNVVNLYGYCAHAEEKLLVYEYVHNESLDKILFPSSGGSSSSSAESISKRSVELDWGQRYGVIVGVARGLLYLHEDAHTPIIHRDIKASNILLDERWNPKIADFGMARLFPEDVTHVKTRIAGTNGYMAPEYVMHGSLSTNADVFSFGVLMLELVSGLKNSTFAPLPDAQSLLEWAWRLHKKGQTLEMMEPALRSSAIPEQVAMCIHIGLLCIQSDPKLRPQMRRVVVMLSKKPNILEEPTWPGIPGFRYRRTPGSQSSRCSSGASSSRTTSGKSAFTSNATNTTTTSSATTSTRTHALASDQQSRSSHTKRH